MSKADIMLNLSEQTLRDLRYLPEELQLTEHDWYEYHYYLKRNIFLLQKLNNLSEEFRNICIMEPSESYIGSILSSFGYRIYYCHKGLRNFSSDRTLALDSGAHEAGGYDVLLLLDMLGRQPCEPTAFLNQASALLKKNGKIFLTTENIASFKNRTKLLLGISLFSGENGYDKSNYRMFGMSDLYDIFSQTKFIVQESSLNGPYQPFKIEPMTLRRYLLKYFSFFVMKFVPVFKDKIFIIAEKGEKKN